MDAYERGKRAGRLEGYEMAVVAYLLTLQNMFELEADDLYRLNMRIDFELQRIIRRGKPYFEMLKRQLRDDYGIIFKWRDEKKVAKAPPKIPPNTADEIRKALAESNIPLEDWKEKLSTMKNML